MMSERKTGSSRSVVRPTTTNRSRSTAMPESSQHDARGRIVRSASVITPLTLVSRVTGYVRDKVIAVLLGASAKSDAFFVALRIPNMLREIVGEGAMSSAFIPVYAEVSETRSEDEARAFVGRALGTFALILVAS